MKESHFQIPMAFSEGLMNICRHTKQSSLGIELFGPLLGSNLIHLNVFIKIKWLLACSFAFKAKQEELKKKNTQFNGETRSLTLTQ